MFLIAGEIYETLGKLEKDPASFLDRTFMLSIFDEWKAKIKDVNKWWEYSYVGGRKTNTVGNTKRGSRVFAMEHDLKLIFNESSDPSTIETTDVTITLGLKAVVHFMEEMISKKPGKATWKFMSVADEPML